MENQESLKNLVVGDEVIVYNRHNYEIGFVTKLSNAQVWVSYGANISPENSQKFNKKTGVEINPYRDTYHKHRLYVATDKLKQNVADRKKKQNLVGSVNSSLDYIRGMVNYLSVEQLEQLQAAFSAIEGK